MIQVIVGMLLCEVLWVKFSTRYKVTGWLVVVADYIIYMDFAAFGAVFHNICPCLLSVYTSLSFTSVALSCAIIALEVEIRLFLVKSGFMNIASLTATLAWNLFWRE